MQNETFITLMHIQASRLWRIRLLQWLLPLLPIVIAIVFASLDSAELERDFGSSYWQWLGPILIVAISLPLPLSAWWLVNHRYVTEIAIEENGPHIRLSLLGPLGQKQMTVERQALHLGEVIDQRHGRVYTPVGTLSLPNGKRAIIDLQADYPHGVEACFKALA